MASIYKRKNDDGSLAWRAVIRIKGHPSVCKSFERKQEAEDWVLETEGSIKRGQFNFEAHKRLHTYKDLLVRLHADRAFEHHRSFKNVSSQFKFRIGFVLEKIRYGAR